jgi:osmotically-inducible protein OsmY
MFLVLAATVEAGPSRIVGDADRDLRQTMQARQLLADEPELAGFNIGVSVHNRVATLWGPVPSAEVAFRAELVVKTMYELTAVHNDLFVSELVEPKRMPLKMNIPPKLLPESVPPKLPEPRSMFGAPGMLTGGDSKRPADKLILGLPQPEAPSVTGDEQLATAVRNLLESKAAYRDVQFIVKDGRVYLRTLSADDTALQSAARAVSRLPNVAGVVLVDKSSR